MKTKMNKKKSTGVDCGLVLLPAIYLAAPRLFFSSSAKKGLHPPPLPNKSRWRTEALSYSSMISV